MTRHVPICILLLAAGRARAADVPVIAVVGVHQPDVHLAEQEDLAEDLAELVERTDKASAAAGRAVGRHVAGRQQIILEEALLSAGRKLLAEGRNLHDQALPAEAIPVLEQAIARLEEGVAVAGDLRDLWEAHLVLGTSHHALGAEEAAGAAFQDAVALNPGRSPDPAVYPPDVTALYDAVRTNSQARAADLEIRSSRPLAALLIDGVPTAGAPTLARGLLPGTHHLRGSGPGLLALGRVRLDGESSAIDLNPVEPTLGQAAESEAARARQVTDLYRSFGRHAEGVDYVLLAGTAGSLLHLQLYDVRADTFSRPTSAPFVDQVDDEVRQTLPLLLNLLGDSGRIAADATQATAVPLDRGANPLLASLLLEPVTFEVVEPRNRRLGLWIGLGAGVLAATGAGVAVAATRSGPSYDGTVIVLPL